MFSKFFWKFFFGILREPLKNRAGEYFFPYPPCLLEELLIKEIIGNWIGNNKPLFATTWQKVLTPKTLAYCQYWQLSEIGLEIKFPLLCHIIAKLFYKIFYSIIWGELPFPPYPPCLLEELPKLSIIGNWIGNKFPSSLPPNWKKIYKVILYNSNLSLFLQNVATAGLQKHGG